MELPRDSGNGYNFRYSPEQWLAYMNLMEFVYTQGRREENRDLEKVTLWRTICMSQVGYGRGCSASSLAESLAMPRETVRRKCEEMLEDGWVGRDEYGYIVGPRAGANVFAPLEDCIDMVLKTAKLIEAAAPD